MTPRVVMGKVHKKFELVLAISLASLAIELGSCGTPQASLPAHSARTLTSISITPTNPVVALGNGKEFTAAGLFSDGAQQDMTQTVVWNSSQTIIATITPSGMIVSKQVGTTTIAAVSGSIIGSTTLTVTQAALVSIAVTPVNPTVPKGGTQQLMATGTFTDGSTQNISSSVVWATFNPGVVTVSSGGLATAQALGTSTLAASSGAISGQDTLTVAQTALVSIAVTPLNPTVPKGGTQQLTATGTFTDGNTQNMSNSVAWTTFPPGVVTVSSRGFLTGQSEGTTAITASAGSIAGAITAVVSTSVVVSIAVGPASSSIPLGFQQQQFSAIGTFSDGSQQDITDTVSWATTQPPVATIDSSGLATTLQIGATDVTAALGSATGSATFNVTSPIMMGINYFTNANTTEFPGATVIVSNPGVTGTSQCAMVYVFDQNEAMTECCGCPTSIDDLRTMLVNDDLTSNPLNGQRSTRGMIKIVPADMASNPSCDPTSISATGEATAWSTHLQDPSDVTEGAFRPVLFTSAEESFLQGTCAATKELGGGQGVCSCGTGD
jgi:hypothetical protein